MYQKNNKSKRVAYRHQTFSVGLVAWREAAKVEAATSWLSSISTRSFCFVIRLMAFSVEKWTPVPFFWPMSTPIISSFSLDRAWYQHTCSGSSICGSLATFQYAVQNNKKKQCSGSMTFWCGSGSGSADPCLWLMDPDADSAIFVIDLQNANKKLNKKSFSAYYFLKAHLHNFSTIKVQKKSQTEGIKVFLPIYAWW